MLQGLGSSLSADMGSLADTVHQSLALCAERGGLARGVGDSMWPSFSAGTFRGA